MAERVRCAGSDCEAPRPFFDGMAYCRGCCQMVQVRADRFGFWLLEHSRSLAVDPQTDRLWTPEFDEGEAAA